MGPFLFNVFAIFTVVTAVGVVVCRNTVNGAMCLLLSLVGVAGLFVGLHAYLLAFLLLLVYAGAIAALFLFIIMLIDGKARDQPRLGGFPVLARFLTVALVGAGVVSFAVRGQLVSPDLASVPDVGANLKLYAYQLFTTYLLPVQMLGFLLLIAMLGVVVLGKRFEGTEDGKK
ncbi:MAG: NADH-quinone oxidoreductase subunit J [Opitutus sp.]